MAKAKGEPRGEVVATVREWEPQHVDDLRKIEHAVDALGRAPGEPAPVNRDHAAIAAAVDKLTKRVKTRKVIVKETVTEYVDAEGPVEVRAASPTHVVDTPTTPTEPVDEGKKLGWFARRKQAKDAKPEAPAATTTATEAAAPPTPALASSAAASDAWDPSSAPAVSAPKPLQSKAAKRTAAKKGSKKKR